MYSVARVGEQNTKITSENKVDFQGAVKVGESGIFRRMDVYYLVMAPLL